MSYPRDIDETSESDLLGELKLRESRREQGWCDYCCREPHEKPCKFPKRHNDPRIAQPPGVAAMQSLMEGGRS